jgi:hypothetical protein
MGNKHPLPYKTVVFLQRKAAFKRWCTGAVRAYLVRYRKKECVFYSAYSDGQPLTGDTCEILSRAGHTSPVTNKIGHRGIGF